jgi:menaquinone-dependent protoporphyrinogen oxidase
MTDSVLVAYGTKNGSTAEVAEAIAAVLRKNGLTADARPARSAEAGVASYDAVVVGGALYAGRWHRDARWFVRRHLGQLAARPLWLFSSGPLDASASEREIPPVSDVRRVMGRLDVREHVTFGGCIQEGAKGYMARMMLRSGRGGDFRDFAAVEAWAERIGAELVGAQGKN